MSTITVPLQRPTRTVGSRVSMVSTRLRRTLKHLRQFNASLDGDRHASLCELTLRHYDEARTAR